MTLDRRVFLELLAAGGAVGLAGSATAAGEANPPAGEPFGVLVDTTRCVGCRGCEAACSEANALPPPEAAGGVPDPESGRVTTPERFTVVNRADRPGPDGEPRWAKSQCFHCLQPACEAACPVHALEKTPAGPVVYHADRCMGCRYCMVACPFGVPKYEYDKPIPYVRKCTFCAPRLAEGKAPACVSACPSGALTFGKRSEILDEARRRVWGADDGVRRVRKVYGEREAGGTSWVVVADVPFESLGYPGNVSEEPAPSLTEAALSAVPAVMTLWPPLLAGLALMSRERSGEETPEHPMEDDRDVRS